MKNSVIFFLFAFFHSNLCTAQIQFQRSIGGTNYDYGYAITRSSDGGYVAAGSTRSFGVDTYGDMYAVKVNSTGTLQWSRIVGSPNYDRAYSIVQTTDGGFIMAGAIASSGAFNQDMFIVKLSSAGTLEWSRTAGGTSGTDAAYSIIQTTDGGYTVAGNTVSFGAGSEDIYIARLNSAGSLLWSKTIGGTDLDYARAIVQTNDGGFAVAGWTYSFGSGMADMIIVKLNSGGAVEWCKAIGGSDYDRAYSMVQTTDGGYVLSGTTYSYGAGNDDVYIVKLNPSGDIQWSRTVGGTNWDVSYSIIQTFDGGYAATGATISWGTGNDDLYIVKLDSAGALQWSKAVGGTSIDFGESIVQSADGGYVVTGYTGSFGNGYNLYVVKFDAAGNTCGTVTSPTSQTGSGGVTTTITPTVTTPATTVTAPSPNSITGATVTTVCTFVGIEPQSQSGIPDAFRLEQNYPNPFNPGTIIKFDIPKGGFVEIEIYDILGRKIQILINEYKLAGRYNVSFDGSNLPSGVYLFKMKAGDFVDTKKMVLVK